MIVLDEADLPHAESIIATIVLTVGLSVVAHGIMAWPLTDAYVRWYEAHPKPPPKESAPAPEQRWRWPHRPERCISLSPG